MEKGRYEDQWKAGLISGMSAWNSFLPVNPEVWDTLTRRICKLLKVPYQKEQDRGKMKERLYREEGKRAGRHRPEIKLEEAVLELYRQIETRTKELRPYGGVWLGEAEKNREKLEKFPAM